jgi:hypothetical protein
LAPDRPDVYEPEGDIETLSPDEAQQSVIDSDFGHSNESKGKQAWEPNWEPTATVFSRYQATTSFYRTSSVT